MDKIRRDIYVLRDAIKFPIDYPQGSDAIDIEFTIRDYDVPSGSTARIYVEKPSGKGVYNTTSISGNVIAVDMEQQMTAEYGNASMQVEIMHGGETLLTFVQPLHVKKSLMKFDSSSGSNFVDEYLAMVQEALGKLEEAREQIIEAAERGDFTASIQVGDTSTLEPGLPAQVTNVGTAMDAIFNFAIPRGKTGLTGPTGPQGIQGPQGERGPAGTDGTNGIVTEVDPGLFALYISEEGHLIVVHNAADPAPPLQIIDGHLNYIIEDGDGS